ncbi:hypothetical protein TEA_023693 [Camellia sinensis var. sinensis]|uniref:Growth-regulating factor n=1 Tax=Camellia sinensis var. sinensis TaxID=542762 RepID=A0A4S4D4E4_CAMSN|nr:hypothetical protein TEA_023693 [Camellia sinensis var. sinensis]
MDLGVGGMLMVGLEDGFVGGGSDPYTSFSSDAPPHTNKQKLYGSWLLNKQERPEEEDDWRSNCLKVAKTTTSEDDFSTSKAALLRSPFRAIPPHTNKQKLYGSWLLNKQERPEEEDDWRSSCLKVAKTTTSEDDFSASKAALLRSPLLRSNSSDGQQILSFSSPNSQAVPLPYFQYQHHSSITTTYGRDTTGYGCGGMNGANMRGGLTVVRGPFTPSQWMELEQQALIYKYITANVPVPSNLLIPIRKALDSAGFSGFSGGHIVPTTWDLGGHEQQALIYKYITANVPIPSNLLIPIRKALDSAGFSGFSGGHIVPTTFGWGAFRLGFSNTTDTEPGRCRRTDGKKWRCSRDAVADQKYCERHMNRGRHRSRKPVECQTGHSVSGPTTATTTSKLMPMASSTTASGVPDSLSRHPQLKNLQPGAANDRLFLNKENVGERSQAATDLCMLSPAIGLKENQYCIPKQQQNPYGESSRSEFGLVCSDSLLNPLHKNSSHISCRNYGSSQDLNDRENGSQRSVVRQFMDDWPKNHTDHHHRSAVSWPNVDLQADRTQLSISIPVAASSDPSNEKLALSSRELEMGLGVGSVVSEPNQRQVNWIPISWENSLGGPLGEVLHSTNNSSGGDCKSSSALNLMTGGWDTNPSAQLASSPTGVLQKMTFRSLSNSSAGSSPRADNHKTHEGNSSLLPAS